MTFIGLFTYIILKINWKEIFFCIIFPSCWIWQPSVNVPWQTFSLTALFQKWLVLYDGTEQGTGENFLSLCQERECFHMSTGNVDVKLVDKTKFNKTTFTIFFKSSITWMIFLNSNVKWWILFSGTALGGSRYFSKPTDIWVLSNMMFSLEAYVGKFIFKHQRDVHLTVS